MKMDPSLQTYHDVLSFSNMMASFAGVPTYAVFACVAANPLIGIAGTTLVLQKVASNIFTALLIEEGYLKTTDRAICANVAISITLSLVAGLVSAVALGTLAPEIITVLTLTSLTLTAYYTAGEIAAWIILQDEEIPGPYSNNEWIPSSFSESSPIDEVEKQIKKMTDDQTLLDLVTEFRSAKDKVALKGRINREAAKVLGKHPDYNELVGYINDLLPRPKMEYGT